MNISVNARSIIYGFLTTEDHIQTISKLSKRDRRALVTKDSDVMASRGKLSIKAMTIVQEPPFNFENFKLSFSYLTKITNGLTLDFSKFRGNVIQCSDWHKLAPVLYCEEQTRLASTAVNIKKDRQNESLHFVINLSEIRLNSAYYFKILQ